MTKPVRCDLRIAKKSKHRGLYKFYLADDSADFILVCADCLAVLVRREWGSPRAKVNEQAEAIIRLAKGE